MVGCCLRWMLRRQHILRVLENDTHQGLEIASWFLTLTACLLSSRSCMHLAFLSAKIPTVRQANCLLTCQSFHPALHRATAAPP